MLSSCVGTIFQIFKERLLVFVAYRHSADVRMVIELKDRDWHRAYQLGFTDKPSIVPKSNRLESGDTSGMSDHVRDQRIYYKYLASPCPAPLSATGAEEPARQ